MKAKYLWVALLSLSIFGCDDNTGTLGLGMFPNGDQNIKGELTTFEVTTNSAKADEVFAKTSIGYLGRFTDPNFGTYEAGFLTQLHCIKNFQFPEVYDKNNPSHKTDQNAIMVKDDIYRTELLMTYSSYFGDSLAPSRLSVYRLTEDLGKEAAYYTDIDPTKYYSGEPMARKAYTAVDLSVKDSIRNLDTYVPSVTVTLPIELGKEIYKASREKKENFYEYFPELFKGIYVKNDFGDGTVLYIDQIELRVVYEVYVRDQDTGEILKTHDEKNDSTAYSYRTFAATKEIIQANSFKNNEELINQKLQETKWTYLKSPAGIYTQAKLPLNSIKERLPNDTLNVVKLTFTNYNQSNENNKYAFKMTAPDYVLLVREKEKDNFFKDNKINDDVTSYLAQHNYINTNQYVFNNLSRLINTCLAEREAARIALKNDGKIEGILDVDNGAPVTTIEAWEKATQWDKVAIIPVTITKDQNTSTNGSIVSILNDLRPGYTKLKGGLEGDKLTLEVTYTSFGEKK